MDQTPDLDSFEPGFNWIRGGVPDSDSGPGLRRTNINNEKREGAFHGARAFMEVSKRKYLTFFKDKIFLLFCNFKFFPR